MSNGNSGEGVQRKGMHLPLVTRKNFKNDNQGDLSWFAGVEETPVELVSEWDGESVTSPWGKEHDACALMSVVNRNGLPSRESVTRVLDGLNKMSHRAGFVNGEGDGCGILIDIPRAFWQKRLEEAGEDGGLAWRSDFWLGHVLVKRGASQEEVMQQVANELEQTGFRVLYNQRGETVTQALGPQGQAEEPYFWQIAGVARLGDDMPERERSLFRLQLRLESILPLQFASLSFHSAVYKLRGSPQALDHYYPELQNNLLTSVATLGHSRYCTNTVSSFFRVQPFTVLGHNGEINTIARLQQEARMLGVQLPEESSDSQDLNRLVETLTHEYGYGLLEAMEIAFPPIVNEIKQLEPELQNLYVFLRQAFGPFAQGPAGIIARQGNECVFSVDALGLRPLWMGQLEDAYFFSSEKGVFAIEDMVADSRPLAPGEKVYVRLSGSAQQNEVWTYPRMQQEALKRLSARLVIPKDTAKLIAFSQPPAVLPGDDTAVQILPEVHIPHPDEVRTEIMMSALGWNGDDLHYIEFLADTGNEPIGSLGYDGPLAALNKERRNLADFFKENVAVVTNPAIDREREIEHFSTRVALGARPSLTGQPDGRIGTGPLGRGNGLFNGSTGGSLAPRNKPRPSRMVELSCPVLLGGHAGQEALLPPNLYWEAARHTDTYLLEELVEFVTQNGFRPEAVCIISSSFHPEEEPVDALNRMALEAITGVEAGAKIVLVDDTNAMGGEDLWLDPHLVVAFLDEALRKYQIPRRLGENYRNLRREASLILRSGSIRNLHDLIVAFGSGADAVNPYLMIEAAAAKARTETSEPEARNKHIQKRVENLVEGLKKGLEKVISTMGIHELRGYGRLFASLGLAPEIARYFNTKNYGGSNNGGFGWAALRADAEARCKVLQGDADPKLARDFHLYPKLWKVAGQVAAGQAPYEKYEQQVTVLQNEDPVALHHTLDFRFPEEDPGISPEEVDISVERHNLPFAISSMSFGSQGETAYKAYAEAGARLNMVALNGEGGEIKEILGKYYNTRGVQIASGRFGVNIELLNSAHLLEIKVGQGAKPGEGGHLPGSKVSAKVAAARNAFQGVDLISPSNNHDIYSIEDLAQFISELKTANPDARVAVKVPVVSGIGTIAIGIAKAGADIITLSGFDGGTGAARAHALKYVGLPSDVGVVEAHRALVASGLRSQVEIWADGGVKTATDALRLVLLGANRVGFATLAMVAIGCTICRACQKDTCHVGIATQIESEEEAKERGLKRFIPQEDNRAVRQLVTLFNEMGEHLKKLVARLGYRRLQDLVGRTDLLVQARNLELVDWSDMLVAPVEWLEQQRELAAERARQNQVCFPCAAAPVPVSVGEASRLITAQVRGEVATNLATIGGSGSGYNQVPLNSLRGEVHYEGERLGAVDRAVGTHLAGALVRDGVGAGPSLARNMAARGMNLYGVAEQEEPSLEDKKVKLYLNSGSIPGNGLAAFNTRTLKIVVEGGAQDGVGKSSLGGQIVILKGKNRWGQRVDGSVGKSFAYGAQRGLFIIQGNADSRFGIRLSGADIVLGGDITEPVDDSLGYIGARANIKGFAFEYMTNGRAIVLGDPGPWICSGMTGGVVYLHLQPEMGLDLAALQRRLAKGAKVGMSRLNDKDKANVRELLGYYHAELEGSEQFDEAAKLMPLQANPELHFVKVQPANQQVDPSISTE
ncbi:MAG TPA: glutamate synthase-related protein [Chloroflexia bacterium]|nr:glutamate synthase-related protein [Chloroflexia bacterium]